MTQKKQPDSEQREEPKQGCGEHCGCSHGEEAAPQEPEPQKQEATTVQEQLETEKAAKLRALADMENLRRRMQTERAQWGEVAVAEFLKMALPGFLELSLARAHTKDEDTRAVLEKFFATLEKQGLKKLEPQPGEPLDTNCHEVMMAAEGEAGTVVQTLEAGWQYKDIVISPAKVSAA